MDPCGGSGTSRRRRIIPLEVRCPNITRLLVLAGSVVLATDQGSLAASPNEAIVAEAGEPPQKLLLEANSSFAFDMYAQLAKEKAGENLFFSPYSMSNALLMATEDVRGQTAREMGTVLGFPKSLQRSGDDGQLIPWEMGRLRVGQSELNRLIHTEDTITPEQTKLRAEETILTASLNELEKKIEAIDKEGFQQSKEEGHYRLFNEKRQVVNFTNQQIQYHHEHKLQKTNTSTHPIKPSSGRSRTRLFSPCICR